MFTDMVGFTAAAQTDEATALQLLHEQEEIVRPVIAADHGREVKSTGDGFLIEFDSALHAVQCAVDIQRRLHERNAAANGPPISVRIGVHVGDVEARGQDIFGDAVNLAARIESCARAGGICISDQAYAQVRNRIPNPIEKLAPKKLKNVRFPLDLYRVALPWDTPGAPSGEASRTRIAVLPLRNISPDPSDAYLADGLTEELINTLSKIRDLRVIARTSVSAYHPGEKTVTQIGSELDVGSVLEGSVRKAGGRLRISLQLIDSASQEPIWADSYDRDLSDIFAVQTEIAERTAVALRLELLDPDRALMRRNAPANRTAYERYLKGISAARQATYEGYRDSIQYFDQAIRLDPEYPPPYSSLANIYILLAGETLAPAEAFPRAQELVTKALALDPNSSEAHTAKGNLALQQAQDWATSEREFKWALSINPSNASAHFWYATLLSSLQRFDQAAEQLRLTIELDPLWSLPKVRLMDAHSAAGELDAALIAAEEERDRTPNDPGPHIDLGTIYARAGRWAEARREAELSGGEVSDYDRMNRAILWARLGEPAEAQGLISETLTPAQGNYVNASRVAALYAAIGDREGAIDWLERDYREGIRGLWFDYQLMAFDSIRDDPRFHAMLERLHLPAAAEARSLVSSGPAGLG
jgi:adenylate cyclase